MKDSDALRPPYTAEAIAFAQAVGNLIAARLLNATLSASSQVVVAKGQPPVEHRNAAKDGAVSSA